MSIGLSSVKKKTRENLTKDITKYLEQGGKITHAPYGPNKSKIAFNYSSTALGTQYKNVLKTNK
jgi:hypothetical protein|tara:strand:- start:2245 stop:2436 length:192 start_codon:yes stop_codon:yes gene_type:complete